MKALQAGDHAFVFAALIVRAGVDLALARKIFIEKNPAGIVALIGKAKMPASMIVMVQQQMGRIAPSQIIEPEDDSTFPMSDDDIDWNIEFFSNMAERADTADLLDISLNLMRINACLRLTLIAMAEIALYSERAS